MPIKPEKKALYPADWKQIRARILERANHRCEQCGVLNHAIGARDAEGGWHDLEECSDWWETEGEGLEKNSIQIVLTIAHVENPDPADCRDENLRALCQRCHNRLDMPMRQANAAETRRQKRARWQPALLETRPVVTGGKAG